MHTVPMKDDPSGVTWEPASQPIGKLLVGALLKHSRDEFKVFYASTSSTPGVQQLRGIAFEASALHILAKGGDFEIAELPSGDDSSPLTFRKITLPPLRRVEFERKKMTDLQALAENELAVPMIGNFESDAFVALRQGLLQGDETPQSTPLACVELQMTKSALHDVSGPGLKRVLKKVEELLASGNLPIVLVFVSESTGITKRQRIVTSSKTSYANGFDQTVSQYVIRLGNKFEELTKMWESS